VLVSDATYARLSPDRAALLEERSVAQLKGKSEAIGLYAPTGDARGRRQRSSAIVPRAG
jgi:class 3 adenylate cyclase